MDESRNFIRIKIRRLLWRSSFFVTWRSSLYRNRFYLQSKSAIIKDSEFYVRYFVITMLSITRKGVLQMREELKRLWRGMLLITLLVVCMPQVVYATEADAGVYGGEVTDSGIDFDYIEG